MQEAGRIVTPGDSLVHAGGAYLDGEGTHNFLNWLLASRVGRIALPTDKSTGKVVVKVDVDSPCDSGVPTVGSIVVAKVTNVNSRMCKCVITCREGRPLQGTFRGLIRREHVRATLRDKVVMQRSFRPGDVILARVLTMGDAQAYLLTTAEPELGVALARSREGRPLVPVSWLEMRCVTTGRTYPRKVARTAPGCEILPR